MLKIRPIRNTDLEEIDKINKFYDFDMPRDHFISGFIIEDEQGIVTVGGLRTLIESVIVTNTDRSVRIRVEALKMMLQASSLACKKFDYDKFHAFITDENWYHQLKLNGFKDIKGKGLIYG